MALVKDILYGVTIHSLKGGTNVSVDGLAFDSRLAKKGVMFFAIKGSVNDGHDYLDQVLESGCTMIVAERELEVPDGVSLVVVESSSRALALVASNFFGEPSKQLKLIGVTGTNGKTSTLSFLSQIFKSNDIKHAF